MIFPESDVRESRDRLKIPKFRALPVEIKKPIRPGGRIGSVVSEVPDYFIAGALGVKADTGPCDVTR